MRTRITPWKFPVMFPAKSLLMAAALTVSAVSVTATAQSGVPAASAVPVTPSCAWEPLGYQTSNVAYPDTSAQYWLLHYTVQKGLTVTLDGRYPDARYASFATYDSKRDSFTDPHGDPTVLADHRIDPDRGSRNPYREKARSGGKFTVTLTDTASRARNVLPLSPTGTAQGAGGTAIYRVYQPNGKIQLPKVTFRLGGHRVRVAQCANALPKASTPSGPSSRPATSAATAAPARPVFARGSGAGLYPNPDNAYLSAGFDAPPAGQVLVVRGAAPATPVDTHARPWPDRKSQVRFWSMCDNLWFGPGAVVANPLPDGTTDLGCRSDSDTNVAADGTYTYVVGTEEQRAAIEKIPGVTFLPLSSATPTDKHLLILRNMLPADDFAEAIQRVPAGSDGTTTAQVMGAYYPRTAYCGLDALTASGTDACPVS